MAIQLEIVKAFSAFDRGYYDKEENDQIIFFFCLSKNGRQKSIVTEIYNGDYEVDRSFYTAYKNDNMWDKFIQMSEDETKEIDIKLNTLSEKTGESEADSDNLNEYLNGMFFDKLHRSEAKKKLKSIYAVDNEIFIEI